MKNLDLFISKIGFFEMNNLHLFISKIGFFEMLCKNFERKFCVKFSCENVVCKVVWKYGVKILRDNVDLFISKIGFLKEQFGFVHFKNWIFLNEQFGFVHFKNWIFQNDQFGFVHFKNWIF